MQFRSVTWVTALLCLAGAAAVAQEPATQASAGSIPTIRTETRLVLVDAVVTDKKGNYVRDLAIKDFKVWEDNKEVALKTFSFGTDPANPSNNQNRYMVLFFDNSSMDMGDQMRARQEAAKFIDANAGPNHLMAIVNFGGSLQIAQNFTADAERLKQVVSGSKTSATSTQVASAGVPRLGGMAQFGMRTMLLALVNLAKNMSEVRGRKSLVLFTSGFPLNAETRPEVTAAIDACNRSNIAIYPIDVRGLTVMPFASPRGSLLPALRDSGIALAGSPVLQVASFLAAWVPEQRGGTGSTGGGTTGGGTTGGGSPGGGGAPRGGGGVTSPGGGSTGGGVNRGGVGGPGTSGPGSTGGTRTGTGNTGGGGNTNPNFNNGNRNGLNGPFNRQRDLLVPRFPESATTNQQVLYELAQGTGGFVIVNTNDLLGGLEKIGKEQNEYYIVGYTPPESVEGSCHGLRVKVNRGGSNVRARTGYCNVKSADVLAGKPAEQQLENRAAGGEAGTIAAKMQAPFFYTAADTARVNVAIEIPSTDIKFDKLKGKEHAEMNVLGIVYRPNAEVAARFSDTVKLDFDDKKAVEQFATKPYHYENQFDVAAGKYTFKVVFSSGGEAFGKLETPLNIDPFDGKQFAISSLALCTDFHKVSDVEANIDAALLEGRSPLMAGALQFTPSGLNRFKTTDSVAIYFELYEPSLTDEKPPGIGVQLRVINAQTHEQKIDSGNVDATNFIHKGNPVVPVALKLPVNMLTAGAYQLEIRTIDSAGRSVARSADFLVQ